MRYSSSAYLDGEERADGAVVGAEDLSTLVVDQIDAFAHPEHAVAPSRAQ